MRRRIVKYALRHERGERVLKMYDWALHPEPITKPIQLFRRVYVMGFLLFLAIPFTDFAFQSSSGAFGWALRFLAVGIGARLLQRAGRPR